jgi:hypothetical protein
VRVGFAIDAEGVRGAEYGGITVGSAIAERDALPRRDGDILLGTTVRADARQDAER